MTPPKKVALDWHMTEILKRQSYLEGYSKTKRLDQYWSNSQKEKYVLPLKSGKSILHEALASIVLFGPAEFNIRSSNGIEIIDSLDGKGQGLDHRPLMHEGLLSFRFEKKDKPISPDDFLEYLPFYDGYIRKSIDCFGASGSPNRFVEYEELKKFSIDVAFKYLYQAAVDYPRDRDAQQRAATMNLFKDFDNLTQNELWVGGRLMDIIEEAYRNFDYLKSSSQSNNIVAKTSADIPYVVEHNPYGYEHAMHRVYHVVLDELISFPRPRTIKATIELLNNPNVASFREVMLEWSRALLENSSDEERLRREIRIAKKSFDRLKTYKKIGRITTFVSAGVGVVGAMAGIPLGLLVTPVGVGLQADAIRRERKHQWMLFARQ